MGYEWWQRALAGEKIGGETLPIHDGEAHCGFFRHRTSKGGGYTGVAIFEHDGKIVALRDNQPVDAAEEWSWCARYPVSEDAYRQWEKTGHWPDESEAVSQSLAHRTDTNNPPTDEAEILKGQIDAASAGVAEYAEIKDDATANKAQSLRSRLLELSGMADKVREAQKKPHFEAGKAVDAKFQPLVKSAKAAADLIRDALGAHETRKAREAARLQAIADEARIKAEREATKARAEAELAGKPVPAPAPAPAPVVPTPEPVTAIRGAYGRSASVKIVKVCNVTDYDAAYQFLRTNDEMKAFIDRLSQKATDSGYSVPGTNITEERRVA